MRPALFVALALMVGLVCQAMAQTPMRRDSDNLHRFFIVKKSGVPVFGSAEATRPERGRSVSLGDFFFALDERGDRVLLCVFSEETAEEVGWVSRTDVLEQRTRALTVGEAIEQGLTVRRFDLDGSFNSSNALPLRVVTQPERGTVLKGRPGASEDEDNPGPGVFSWRWYYVYDQVVADDGKRWLLLADQPELLVGKAFDHTKWSGPRDLIRGWAPLEEMTLWATNLAIELNTEPIAVTERIEEDDPSTVYNEPHLQAEHLWGEELDELWGEGGRGRPELAHMVSTDPVGLGPNFPRLSVLDRLDGYLEVASAASSRPGLSASAIGQLQRDVLTAAETLRKADVVFVVDATGSMRKAMRETIGLLRRVGDEMRKYQESGVPRTIALPGGRTEEISTALSQRVSVIGFQDVNDSRRAGYNVEAKVVQADLVHEANDIDEAFRELIADTRGPGGREALHDGLREAMKDRYWREDTVNRVVILMTDEQGDTRDLQALIREMPVFSDEALEVAPGLKAELERMPEIEHKKLRTKLYSVFLGPERQWRIFNGNVEAASSQMFRLYNFNNRANDAGLVDAVGEVLLDQQNTIDENVKAFATVLEGKHEGGAVFDMPGGMTELAIADALRRAGLSQEALDDLNSVAYYQGYVRDSTVILPEASDEENAGALHWRLRVLVSEADVHKLQEVLGAVTTGLRAALDENALIRLFGPSPARRELIAGVILRAIDQVTGRNAYSNDEEGEALLRTRVRGLLEAVRSGDEILLNDLSGLMKLQDSLPIASDGLLGLSIGDLFEQREDWFHVQQRRLLNLLEGWRRIGASVSITENPGDVQSAPRRTRYWLMETGLGGNRQDRTAYVPFAYIP